VTSETPVLFWSMFMFAFLFTVLFFDDRDSRP
jgi:hypothetical protein